MNALTIFWFAKYVSRLHLEEQFAARITAQKMGIDLSFEDNYLNLSANGYMILYGKEWDSWEICGDFDDVVGGAFTNLGFRRMGAHCFQKNHITLPTLPSLAGDEPIA